jgi:hypothetical protein
MVKRGGVIASAVVLICIGAPSALAQSASQQGYNGEAPLGQVEGLSPQQEFAAGGDSGPAEVVSESAGGNGGALPFTGWDLGIVLALGLALAGTGLVVRRAARSSAD